MSVGDIVVAGSQWGRVRALIDDKGRNCVHAGPSFPVEVLGFNGAPEAGDRVAVVESEARAREITEYRERQKREQAAARGGSARASLADMMSQLKTAGRKEFPLVIKGDVQGSVEAIIAALEKLGTDEVAARVIHAGVGGITESDITLAEASKAAVIGFNVRAHKEAREAAETARHRNPLLQHHLQPRGRREGGHVRPAGADPARDHARQCARSGKCSTSPRSARSPAAASPTARSSAASMCASSATMSWCTKASCRPSSASRTRSRKSLAGQECGMAFENYQDMRAGDVIECYRVEEIKRSL